MDKRKPELGVCYYPEHWPEEIWVEDARRMVEMGLSWVRIGEFAWSRIEPKPGQFKFGWLDRAIKILGDAGLKVVMCTPTATPPRWMLDKHPDMLAWDVEGRPRGFGSRRHYDFSHAGYIEECRRIAGVLGERYGQNSAVQAWQIDNEYGCHDTTLSYSPVSKAAFQVWLSKKYNDISDLNLRWGNVFWSMEYDRFDQIDLPNLTVTEPNPSHAMDFRRFASDAVVSFNLAQAEVLRAYTDAPLIHNYMGRITDFDHYTVGEDLDIASWDSYPLGFLEDRSDRDQDFKRQHMRCGDPDFQAFHHDIYRRVGKGRWWVMEQQPGPVNWAPHNPIPTPGMVRLWALEAFAHGAEVVCFFRWRQAPFAQEQMHAGLLLPDGTLSAGGREIQSLAEELNTMNGIGEGAPRVGLVFDYPSQWAWDVQPQDIQFDYFRLVYDIYRGLRRRNIPVDIINPNDTNIEKYATVFAPGIFSNVETLKAAAEKSQTHLVMGPRFGSRTEDFTIPRELPPQLEGIRITAVETLRDDAPLNLQSAGAIKIWWEVVETDWSVIKQTRSKDPIVLQSGYKTYWAGWPDDAALDDWLGDLFTHLEYDVSEPREKSRNYGFKTGQLAVSYLDAKADWSQVS